MLFGCDGFNTSPYKRTWIRASERGIHLSRMLGSGNGVELVADYTFLPDVWYHISVNYDGTNTALYINGSFAEYTFTGDIIQDIGNVDINTTAVTIGGNQQDNSPPWKGLIDQTYVYNRTLSAAEIKDIYEEGEKSILDEGLVAYYPFNGNANDVSGNGNDGTVNGATLTTDRFGNTSKAYSFNGVDNNIIIDYQYGDKYESEYSFSLWINPGAFQAQYAKLFCTPVAINSWESPYSHFDFTFNGRELVFASYWNTEGNPGVSTQNLDAERWQHIVFLFNNGAAQVYINGVLNNSTNDFGLTQLYFPNQPISIGSRTFVPEFDGEFFKGELDDMRFYNRVLDEEEIQKLYHENGNATVTDIDGNTYGTIQIGNQAWMAENLKTTKYQNGDDIGTTTPDNLDISGETSPKYQWAYLYDENIVDTYGRLYTWYAAVDERNVCPAGWHVPSDDEWKELEMFLGMTQEQADAIGWRGTNQGTQLKSESGWIAGGADVGTNTVRFNALPVSLRETGGVIGSIGTLAAWWTSTEYTVESSWYRYLNNYNNTESNGIVRWYNNTKSIGMTIRCLKNSEHAITVNDVTFNDGQQVIVPISVSNLTSEDNIIAYQFDIDIDNATLEYIGNDLAGTLAEGGTVEVNNSVAGKLSIRYMTTTALVGAGELIKLQFNSLMADTTEALISNAYLNSSPIVNLANGTVIVKDITPPTATISYDDTENRSGDDLLITATFNEPMLEANAVKISMTGGATLTDVDMTRVSETAYTYLFTVPNSSGDVTISLSNGTDLWGNEVVATPTSGETFSIVPVNLGDVDDDGTIFAYDAALTLQYSVGLDPLPTIDPLPWENWRVTTANVDGVGTVSANDAGMILQYSVGIITSFDAATKKSATAADVTVEVIGTDIVFYSSGELIGLNVSTTNENSNLGEPIDIAEGFLSAFNIDETTFKVGLCTSTPAFEGDILMKIPYNANGSVTFDLVVNAVATTLTVDLATGIINLSDLGIRMYPNPASDWLHVAGHQNKTIGRIYNANGQLISSSEIDAESGVIDVSLLPSGLYILKINVGDEVIVKRFTKK